MDEKLTLSEFNKLFPDDDSCLEKIFKSQYPKGINCIRCKKTTKHYKINKRLAYSCKYCRNQIFPLKNTVFEKTTTPLSKWFYAMYIMTQTRGKISATKLRDELNVTYKTAWRINKLMYNLMKQNNGDLLKEAKQNIFKITFLDKIELRVIHKNQKTD